MQHRFAAWPCWFALTFCLATPVLAQTPGRGLEPGTQIRHPNQIEVLIPAVGGTIQWRDVAASVADAMKLDAGSIERMLPKGQLDLRSDAVLLVLMGIDLAAGDAISFTVVRDQHNRDALCVRCDRSLFAAPPNAKPSRAAILEVDDDWSVRALHRPIVVCLHGLRGTPDAFGELRQFLRAAGYATAAVTYDADQGIAESARQLSVLAEERFGAGRQPRLALVGHSMGGLVAREWTENGRLGGLRIERLITIGTPHGGSNWATMPPLLDLLAEGGFDRSDLLDVILHQPSAAGLRDLAPTSEFLRRLSSRPRRDDVAYTAIVGTGSPVDETEVAELRRTLRDLDRESSFVRLIRPRIRPLLESFDELVRGKGDGIVAVARATMPGVDDVVEVDLSHFEMLRPIPGRSVQPVWRIVLDRLQK